MTKRLKAASATRALKAPTPAARELFNSFLTERVYLKNITQATKDTYEKAWRGLGSALPERVEDLRTPDEVANNSNVMNSGWCKDRVLEVITKIRQRGLAPTSINVYARHMNAFLKWLHDEHHMDQRLKIPLQRIEQNLIQTFSQSDVERLAAYRPTKPSAKRVWTLAMLILDTGMRIDEALKLKRENIDLNSLLLTIIGKGRKQRKVPMSIEGRKILYRWLQSHQYPVVFATRAGRPLAYRNALRDFKGICKGLGLTVMVDKRFHILRHTFATNYLRSGGDLMRLNMILGHTSLEMTKKYLHLVGSDLTLHHDKHSPLSS